MVDAAYNEDDATEMAYAIAASIAVKDAVRLAKPVIMEPCFRVEVVTPEEYVGEVIADLSSRYGRIEGIQSRDILQVVTAVVPLSQLFGYVTQLRSLTQGRGSYTMVFDHYEPAVLPLCRGMRGGHGEAIFLLPPITSLPIQHCFVSSSPSGRTIATIRSNQATRFNFTNHLHP
jgi:elongation factor G